MTDGVASAVKLVEAQVGYQVKTSKKHLLLSGKEEAITIDEVLQSTYR